MPPAKPFAQTLQVICREASRFPWICLSALRTGPTDGDEPSVERNNAPEVDAEPVLVLGGLFSHPTYYAPLGRILVRRGYGVHFDDVMNVKPFLRHMASLRERVDAIVQATGRPLRIVGHSLGGMHAMALLLERPDAIKQVIAVASPIGGTPWGPLQRVAEQILQMRRRDAQGLRKRVARYAARITTIASPHDLIAPPQRCAVNGAANVVLTQVPRADEHLESHGGVIFMRAAVRAVLAALGASDTRIDLATGLA